MPGELGPSAPPPSGVDASTFDPPDLVGSVLLLHASIKDVAAKTIADATFLEPTVRAMRRLEA
jgi:hypothetical protein